MKVVAINGSPNLGYTNYMVDQVIGELVSRGIECEKFILSQYKISLCMGCPDCRARKICPLQDDATSILDKYRKADGVILSSPVWFHTITSYMKVFMDRSIWLNRHGGLPIAKCIGMIAIAQGIAADLTLEELKKFFTTSEGTQFSDAQILTIAAYHHGELKPADMVDTIEQAKNMGRQMADILYKP